MQFRKLHEEILISEKKGNVCVNYFVTQKGNVYAAAKGSENRSRLEVISTLKRFFEEIFLPQGYPSSVSADYLDYQIWDTVQGFCSTISGTLTTHAIFKGVGVGDMEATALAATITWIIKDGTGMVGRIGFAWWKGFLLDTDCKKWRLAADIINDVAMCTELLLGMSAFKKHSSLILCMATAMKSIVGVAGGATRAAITQHQAIRSNMGDVCAKDGSQETCVNLLGSFVGIFILTRIEGSIWSVWILFALATILHVYANYKAVTSLNITTLNNNRLILLTKHFLQFDEICIPKIINKKESVFLGFGETEENLCSRKIYVGCSLENIIEKKSNGFNYDLWKNLQNLYQSFPYLISYDNKSVYVVLTENISNENVIMAYFHALILGIVVKDYSRSRLASYRFINDELRDLIDIYNRTGSVESHVNKFVSKTWDRLAVGLSSNGWIINRHQLSVQEYRIKMCEG